MRNRPIFADACWHTAYRDGGRDLSVEHLERLKVKGGAMLALRSATLPVLLALLIAFGYFSSEAGRVLAADPGNGAPLVSQGQCVNGSVPGPYGCTSTLASSSYYNYPQSYYYNAAYNYCYAYYPTCQYYQSYYNYDYVYPKVYVTDCNDPVTGTIWVAQSMTTVVCT
jgi:hypothetical protein